MKLVLGHTVHRLGRNPQPQWVAFPHRCPETGYKLGCAIRRYLQQKAAFAKRFQTQR